MVSQYTDSFYIKIMRIIIHIFENFHMHEHIKDFVIKNFVKNNKKIYYVWLISFFLLRKKKHFEDR